MNGEEIYINGERCDTDANSSVTMRIVSNLFGDVSKILSNSTYSIRIPKTRVNRKILGHSDVPTNRTGLNGYQMIFDYYRDGAKLISNGIAVISSCDDKYYSINVTFGIGSYLKAIDSEGKSLKDLNNYLYVKMLDSYHPVTGSDDPSLTEYQYKNSTDFILAEYDPFMFVKPSLAGSYWATGGTIIHYDTIQLGKRTWANAGDHILPSVMLDKIVGNFTNLGISLQFTDQSRAAKLSRVAIPLASRNASGITSGVTFQHTLANQTSSGQHIEGSSTIVEFGIGENVSDTLFTRVIEEVEGSNTAHLEANVTMNAFIRVEGVVHVQGVMQLYGNSLTLYVGDNSYDLHMSQVSKGYYSYEGSGFIRINTDDELRMKIKLNGVVFQRVEMYSGTLFITESYIVDGEVPVGFRLPIYFNLPNIKIIELIKYISFITGTFPKNINGSNVITLENISSIFSKKNTANSVDWTSKIIDSNELSSPSSASFNIQSWAQKNWYKMKENEFASTSYDGCLTLNNETLEKERDAYSLPFVAEEGLHYPIYEKKEVLEEGVITYEYNFKGGKPSALGVESLDYVYDAGIHVCGLAFNNDVSPSKILEAYYQELKSCVERPYVITASVNLTNLDIANFDETKPVYLAQYGHYYAVLEISTTYGKYASVKLLQI